MLRAEADARRTPTRRRSTNANPAALDERQPGGARRTPTRRRSTNANPAGGARRTLSAEKKVDGSAGSVNSS
jgi:hypothetical protein